MKMAVRLVLAGAVALAVTSARTGAGSAAEPDGLKVEVGVKMKTRDGVALAADIYRPRPTAATRRCSSERPTTERAASARPAPWPPPVTW